MSEWPRVIKWEVGIESGFIKRYYGRNFHWAIWRDSGLERVYHTERGKIVRFRTEAAAMRAAAMLPTTLDDPHKADRRYRAMVTFEAFEIRTLKTEAGAKRWAARMEAAFKAAQKVCDGEIWTSIDLIYLTRWDCPTARLAAALCQ